MARSVKTEIPNSTSDLIRKALTGNKSLPKWLYPRTETETIKEYIEDRRGQFDSTRFTIYINPDKLVARKNNPLETPPRKLCEAIRKGRRGGLISRVSCPQNSVHR